MPNKAFFGRSEARVLLVALCCLGELLGDIVFSACVFVCAAAMLAAFACQECWSFEIAVLSGGIVRATLR